MKVGIICNKVSDKENLELKKELERVGFEVVLITPDEIAIGVGLDRNFLHKNVEIDDIAGFIIRGVGLTLLNKSFFRLDVLYSLGYRGHVLLNSARSTELALNKTMSSVILDANGIPTPKTIVAEDVKHAINGFMMLGSDILVKPIYGSQGVGIFRLQDKGYAERVFIEMFQKGFVFYLQEFKEWMPAPGLDVHKPFDIRIFIVGNEIAGAMLREAASDSTWKTNIHAGAIPRAFDPSQEIKELALKSADIFGLGVAGVDLMYSDDQWFVLEVNCAPGWTGISKVCNTNFPALIAEHLKNILKC
ncbi:MAG: RimK family alpha-L-glutamate ligase [Promethearchaeota archaeon]